MTHRVKVCQRVAFLHDLDELGLPLGVMLSVTAQLQHPCAQAIPRLLQPGPGLVLSVALCTLCAKRGMDRREGWAVAIKGFIPCGRAGGSPVPFYFGPFLRVWLARAERGACNVASQYKKRCDRTGSTRRCGERAARMQYCTSSENKNEKALRLTCQQECASGSTATGTRARQRASTSLRPLPIGLSTMFGFGFVAMKASVLGQTRS